ncbi:MAG: hypothetical protein HOB42_04725 [Candidatus Marinimicrobia bacterium]|jgi:hypothetical protein|nr:hypothetical protein [Candidatus Neomarinimicrobiota bacterium]MBT5177164.1 hypothetical protein [Candidatus Neomarinimicrobiota bacterium]MBT6637259.1 hypothetical protein [Candidatus Neomarinimicrobiota bacterium]
MKNLNIRKWLFIATLSILLTSCDRDNKCNNCGDVFGGFIFMKVTASDIAKYEGLAQLNGIDVGVCIRAYILEEELNLNTVSIADDCCCEY